MDTRIETQPSGVVRGIAYRPRTGAAMVETQECRVLLKRGLDTEDRKPGTREVTLLSVEAWVEACRQLGAAVPWHARRANLLVEGIDLASTLGSTLSIGEVRIKVHGESKPCEVMERQIKGLCAALAPDCRGGVHGQVLQGGAIRVGDRVSVVAHRAGEVPSRHES